MEAADLQRIPTWPWSPGTPRGVVAAVFLPVILWLVQFGLQRLLGMKRNASALRKRKALAHAWPPSLEIERAALQRHSHMAVGTGNDPRTGGGPAASDRHLAHPVRAGEDAPLTPSKKPPRRPATPSRTRAPALAPPYYPELGRSPHRIRRSASRTSLGASISVWQWSCFLATVGVQWADGTHPFGVIGRDHLLGAFLTPYALGMMHYLDRSAVAAIRSFRPALRGGETTVPASGLHLHDPTGSSRSYRHSVDQSCGSGPRARRVLRALEPGLLVAVRRGEFPDGPQPRVCSPV